VTEPNSPRGAEAATRRWRGSPGVTLAISGLLGFWFGLVVFPTWHVAVETAQVVAGTVRYPAENPFYRYHVGIWTIVHQILAVALSAGITERALSELLSGLVGMLSFQALAIVVHAFSRDSALAVGTALVMFLARGVEFGAVYPVLLLGTTHTYGALGLSTLVLALGLLGCGWSRSGGFLLGVLPAIHPSIGVWTCALVAVVLVVFRRSAVEELRPARQWVIGGLAVTALSLLAHLPLVLSARVIETEPSRPYLVAFLELWDGHRSPVPLRSVDVTFNAGAMTLAIVWLMAWAQDLPRASRFLLRAAVASVLLGTVCTALTWMPAERLPMPIVMLMPGRVLNIGTFLFPPMVFGLLGAYRRRVWVQGLILFATAALALSRGSRVWGTLRGLGWTIADPGYPVPGPLIGVVVLFVVGLTLAKIVEAYDPPWPSWERLSRLGASGLAGARTIALALFAAWLLPKFVDPTPFLRDLRYRDRVRDHVFAAAAEGRGLLLTAADLHLIQLRTRRPVLIDGGGLDGLVYASGAAPRVARVMTDVYGVDFFNPPEGRGRGTMPRAANRAAWEGYSRERWTAIGREYGVTEVVTFLDWRLDLPLVAESWDLRLYRIPE
jgi:hypothetical protein